MSDFYQHGQIATLGKLRERKIEEIEDELVTISKKRKMALLLPALVSEFDTPAMPKIIGELKKVPYLEKVVLSLDKADREQFLKVKQTMSELPMNVRVVWHDGPRVKGLLNELLQNDFSASVTGKGRSVWMTMGYILSEEDIDAIALHDCDIINYSRELLARLIYPVIHPALDYDFGKGYYARVTDKMYGRVTRLFYIPLIYSLKKILGYTPFLEYLGSFRYALSGEFAIMSSLARKIRISPTWGLEISFLNEIYHRTSTGRICQIEIIDRYEHKHQTLKKDKPDEGLIRMARDIAEALFRVLSQDGIVLSQSFFRTLFTSYIEESRRAIEKYHVTSMLNGLVYDRHSEIEATEAFVGALKNATRNFVEDPVGIPMMSAWVRVNAAIPNFQDRLNEIVEEDNS